MESVIGSTRCESVLSGAESVMLLFYYQYYQVCVICTVRCVEAVLLGVYSLLPGLSGVHTLYYLEIVLPDV